MLNRMSAAIVATVVNAVAAARSTVNAVKVARAVLSVSAVKAVTANAVAVTSTVTANLPHAVMMPRQPHRAAASVTHNIRR